MFPRTLGRPLHEPSPCYPRSDLLMQKKPLPDARIIKLREYEDKLRLFSDNVKVGVARWPSLGSFPGASAWSKISRWVRNCSLHIGPSYRIEFLRGNEAHAMGETTPEKLGETSPHHPPFHLPDQPHGRVLRGVGAEDGRGNRAEHGPAAVR